MPHVIVKLTAGRSEEMKQALAQKLAEALTTTIGCGAEVVSVAIEDVPIADWTEAVYIPEIEPQFDRLYIKPGYGRA
ncbi:MULTISPECIES: tautomerase family protein [unclassified Aureimonas]|uniref:tautomerase family protein n=1 Tax=unclassified Aureimonas TaxID=2615206 RepID=UPI0006F97627|nr:MULTISPECIES: tautomerase family protein [unclassified Aureimonas]KQT62574.1 4-oxalocrotonate tautomerase [Aureimonas sp. Leaf427]KQT73200.1 4-oxalocrotonate tautomerase [Aureimonas sp. Leaf460]